MVRGRIVPFFRSLPRGIAPLSLDAPVGRTLARANVATTPARRPSFGDLFATPTLPNAGDGAPGSAPDVGAINVPAGRFAGSFFGIPPGSTAFQAATGPVTVADIAKAATTTTRATVGTVVPVVGVPNAVTQLGLALFGFVAGLIQGVTSPKPAPTLTATTETLATATAAAKSAITTRGAPDPIAVLARAVQAVVAIVTGFVNPQGFNPTVFSGVPGATAAGVASAVSTGFTANAADAQAAANLGFAVHNGLVPGTFTISNVNVGAATGNAPPGSTNFSDSDANSTAGGAAGAGEGGAPAGSAGDTSATGDTGEGGGGVGGSPSAGPAPGSGDGGDGGSDGGVGDGDGGPAGGSDGGVGGAGE